MFPFNRDAGLVWLLRGCAAASSAIVALILFFLAIESWPALQNVGWARFFLDPSWHPGEHADDGTFNLLPILYGTLLATAGSVLLATPLGILSAIFCRHYAPRSVAAVYRRLLELLAGIPSVIYGFWGLVVLVPLIRELSPPGPSLLAGILVLTVMILPTMAMMADATIGSVPRSYLRAASALGLTRWGVIRRVVLPVSRSGLFTGAILQTTRAIGETMAILMVCGNVVQTPRSIFDPVRTLTANIALEMGYAAGDHRSALFVSGLLLLLMVVGLIAAAEVIRRTGHHVPR